MSKTKSKKRLRRPDINDELPRKKDQISSRTVLLPDNDLTTLNTAQSLGLHGLHPDDLDIAIQVLNTLTQNPSILKSKECRNLRTAVYEFRQACTTGLNASDGSNLTSRVSGALADGRYTEAHVALAEMRARKLTPKLGAVCRWVRDLDVVSGMAEELKGHSNRTLLEKERLIVLDAILRASGPIDHSFPEAISESPIFLRYTWDLRDSQKRELVYDSVIDHSIFKMFTLEKKSQFRVIQTTPGSQRKPPNLFPAILYTSEEDTIELSSKTPEISHKIHTIVPNLHLLKDVLSTDECLQIIAAAETLGFTPDSPVGGDGEKNSILAHNFYWIVDTAFATRLWARVEPFVPAVVEGKTVRGLNRRFRVYRYVPGAEYRVHIDGAWPPSGIDPVNDTYIYDSSPSEAKQSSLYTFLIYLNDDFEGGETTFFLPSAMEGHMNAYPVKPIQGSLIMFPHGDAHHGLLHEGTGVLKQTKPTAKYVIRTDILYDVKSL
ncbi:hypothetical protein K3495_g13263 [Podosphaera aphanis]|nr:hypothetical protein K3495_g13263 [Podosphaera aphanis]